MQVGALSDIGTTRQRNEDAWDALPRLGLAIIADGLGGHRAGDVAARRAVGSATALIQEGLRHPLSGDEVLDLLRRTVQQVNEEIYALAWEDASLMGMGTTLCILLWREDAAYYAHVGDSRIYLWEGAEVEQLTRDHSVIAEMEEAGMQQLHPPVSKNMLTQAVGTSLEVQPAVGRRPVHHGTFILCTDGLSNGVSPVELAEELQRVEGEENRARALETAAHRLVELAKAHGSCDNITIVLCRRDP